MIYFILTVLLTFFYFVIIYLANSFFMVSGKSSVVFPFLPALFMVLRSNPIKKKVRKFIDNLFFRGFTAFWVRFNKTSETP